MLAAERRDLILRELRRTGAVAVADLAARLDVSAMTVRRDLDVLAADGLLDKVHGGARAAGTGRPGADEPGFDASIARRRPQKEAIARAAAALVEPGMAVGVSAGSTAWTLARVLRDVPGVTVVTNSLRVSDLYRAAPRADEEVAGTVVLVGGIRTPSDALVGPVAVRSLEVLHLDLVFLGVHGIDAQAGLTTPNLLEAETDRALVAAGRRVVVVADSSKWGRVGLTTIADLDAVHEVVTDDGLPAEGREVVEAQGARLTLVPVPDAGA